MNVFLIIVVQDNNADKKIFCENFYNSELKLQMMSPSDVSFYCKFGKSNIATYES